MKKKPYLQQNISNHKLDRSDKKANTNNSPEMKISCNVKQHTSLVKNSSLEIKDKTNEKKPYLQQNISNYKLVIRQKSRKYLAQGTSLVKNSEIKDKTNEKKAISTTKYI